MVAHGILVNILCNTTAIRCDQIRYFFETFIIKGQKLLLERVCDLKSLKLRLEQWEDLVIVESL